MAKKLIFVYNASNKLGNKLIDYAHKVIKPSTYACDLCSITHNHIGMKSEWKDFLNNIEIESEFLYKEDFVSMYTDLSDSELPIVMINTEDNNLRTIVHARDFKNIHSIADLNHKILANID